MKQQRSTTNEENATNETNDTVTLASVEDISKYNKNASVIRKRLKKLGVEDYTVTVDPNTGKIDITLPENKRHRYYYS